MTGDTAIVNEILEPDPQSAGFLLAEEAAWWALQKNADDLVILDLRGRSDVCDFFLVGSGAADVQVKAIGREIQERLRGTGHEIFHTEGLDKGRWVLLDLFDVVVHVFHPESRSYYKLENLWGDVPRLEIPVDHFDDEAVRMRHPQIVFPPRKADAADGKEAEES